MKCNFCGEKLLGREKYCPNCGSKTGNDTVVLDENIKSTESTRSSSIVLGIVSLVGIFLGIFAPISLILSIIGLILAIKSNHNVKNPVGIVLNIISLFLSIIITLLIILIIYFTFFAVNHGIDIIDNYSDHIYERY